MVQHDSSPKGRPEELETPRGVFKTRSGEPYPSLETTKVGSPSSVHRYPVAKTAFIFYNRITSACVFREVKRSLGGRYMVSILW